MRSSDIPKIRELDLFASMGQANFDSMIQAAYLQTFPAHLDLISEGDPADFLYIVIEGCVELYARSGGRESTMGMVASPGTFILAAALKDAVYLMSARTTRKSTILLVPAEHVREAFEVDDVFARSIVVELANCYRSIVKEHKNLKLRSAVERLANRLIRYHNDQGANGSIELPHDKRTIASMLAMTPENLSRAFNTLKPYAVEVDGMTVRLGDVKALEKLAKPNALIDDWTT